MIYVVIPTYNERETIEKLISRILALRLNLKIVVVDDNSPDGTGKLVARLSHQLPEVELIQRGKKLGLGTAYVAGLKYALKRGADLILTMDADFSHQPRYIPQLLEGSQEVDLVIGSRYVAGGGVNYPFYRKFLSQIANLWARFFLNLPVRDSTAGFKCFRRKIFKNFNLENFVSSGYIFNVETVYYAHKLGFKIKEVPIIFEDREKGKTKMSVGEILQGFVGLFRIKRNNLNPVC